MPDFATGVIRVPPDNDNAASPLAVRLGGVSAGTNANIVVENIGSARVKARTRTTAETGSFVDVAPGRRALVEVNGVAGQAITLDVYVPRQPRFIHTHQTGAPVSYLPGRLTVYRDEA